ncbi:protein of unknown function [Pararobbsia alpina]
MESDSRRAPRFSMASCRHSADRLTSNSQSGWLTRQLDLLYSVHVFGATSRSGQVALFLSVAKVGGEGLKRCSAARARRMGRSYDVQPGPAARDETYGV